MLTATRGPYVLVIQPDDDPFNPREDDNFGKMVCFHRRYHLGDHHNYIDKDDFLRDLYLKTVGAVSYTHLDVYKRQASGSREQRKPVEKKPFRLPWVKRCATFAVSYLQRRGVHSDIIRRCMQLGLFYESRYNNEAVCVFVGRDDTGTGRFACVRGIAGDLKKDISGSDKRFSFCYPPDQPGSRHLAVFEAPIDALSHATLQKLEGWQWNGYRLSLGGTSPVALVAFLERHPEITRVALYLDNDLAGRVNARKIKALLKSCLLYTSRCV